MTNGDALAERKALVMGADTPVAAAIALALADAGMDVAVTSTSGDPEEAFSLRPLRRRLEATGRRAIADIADLGNGSSVQIAVRQIAKQLGGIDLLVIAPHQPLLKPAERLTDAEWNRVLGYNLGAYLYACRAAVREMAGNDGMPKGRIVALLTDVDASAGSAAMQAARSGAQALVQALARDWAPDVLVNAVALPATLDEPATELPVAAVLRLAKSTEAGEIVAI